MTTEEKLNEIHEFVKNIGIESQVYRKVMEDMEQYGVMCMTVDHEAMCKYFLIDEEHPQFITYRLVWILMELVKRKSRTITIPDGPNESEIISVK